MKNLFLITCFILIFLGHSIFGCSLVTKPLRNFDSTEYIFIGEVIGYTDSLESPDINGQANGLVVKLKESVHLPQIPKTHFEIFPYGLGADCSTLGASKEELQRDFPIHSEVRVIAKEARILPKLSDGNVRLEERPGELGSISLNTEQDKKAMFTKNKVFNYKSFKYVVNEYSGELSFLPDFEVRKDLLRLKNSKTHVERIEILNRLLQIPPHNYLHLDFYSIFKTYTRNESEFKRFDETRLRMELTKAEFRQYKTIESVRSKLIILGYQHDDVDKAIGKAIEEGYEISKQKLFERSLQLLSK